MNERELTALFRKIGAREPAAWAHSQISEGMPQLARFLFLRQAWKLVVSEHEHGWMEDTSVGDGEGPGDEMRLALTRLLDAGVSKSDLGIVVRTMQWHLLFGLCQLMDDPGALEVEVQDIAWRLFQVDEDDQPIAVMSGMHESVLEAEPRGTEMRPVT